jgi:hypothetical protein
VDKIYKSGHWLRSQLVVIRTQLLPSGKLSIIIRLWENIQKVVVHNNLENGPNAQQGHKYKQES